MDNLLDFGWKDTCLDLAWESYSKPIQKFGICLNVSKYRNHNDWIFAITFLSSFWGSPPPEDFDADFTVTVESVRAFEEQLLKFEEIDLHKIYDLAEDFDMFLEKLKVLDIKNL